MVDRIPKAWSSSYCACHLFKSENKPPLQVLRLHLNDKQNIVFNHGEEEHGLEQGRLTELTAFFLLNYQQKVLLQEARYIFFLFSTMFSFQRSYSEISEGGYVPPESVRGVQRPFSPPQIHPWPFAVLGMIPGPN